MSRTCVSVDARTDGGEPSLMTREVGVGLLELGVCGPAPAALKSKLLVELPGALDDLAVLGGPPALHRVDDCGLLPRVDQMDADHLALATLRAQSGHEPGRGARRLRRRRE
jgi:hypothetical protein